MILGIGNKFLITCGLFGVVFLILGTLVTYKIIPDLITKKIWDMKILKNDTEQFDMFMKTPFPFTFKVYFFNIQNPNEILNGAKPILREVGPYVYRLHTWKDEVKWYLNNNDDISYNEYSRYIFDKEASGIHSEDDMVTIINTPLYSFLLTAEDISPDALETIADALPLIFKENSNIFLTTKVKDYLWDGIKLCPNEGKDDGFAAKMICSQIVGKLNMTKAMRLQDHTVLFANLYYKNNTSPGIYTVKSGNDEKLLTGELILYNQEQYISKWQPERSNCNKIRGKTTVFPVNVTPNMTFESFNPDICRVMKMEYKGEETVKEIRGLKFGTLKDSFSTSAGECFCLNTSKIMNGSLGCIEEGLMDLSSCTGGPVLLSFPHLLHADKKYLDTVNGLNPDEKQHETFVVLEPYSGTPLKLAKRVQFNMFLRPIQDVFMIENVTNSVIPLLWVEESMTLEDKYTDQIKNSLLKVISVVDVLKWVILVLGGLSILVPFFCLVYIK